MDNRQSSIANSQWLPIGIAADHAGVPLKAFLITWLEAQGYAVRDFGAYTTESVDYPDVARPLADALLSGEVTAGISLCGTGNGISMTLNRYPGIRAALCWQPEIARLARAHNNANVCSLPARFLSPDTAQAIVATFLATSFDGGRHQRRIEKLEIRN
ncbi:MAG: ribose 5-phosphate isomerase B [Prevotellaceae bacterium]|jgi:ribose 5-phosphate isomerase B|nr:ribose 5-phosphate isomerase B [Prevotellaceae bacterium]